MNKKERQKVGLVFSALLSRLTDFELATADESFVDTCEEIRGGLVDLEERIITGREKNEGDDSQLTLGGL